MFSNIDTAVFDFINKTCQSTFLDMTMPYITELGAGLLFFFAFIMLLVPRKRVKLASLLLMAGLTFAYNIVRMLKFIIARPRPFVVRPDVNNIIKVGGFAFPSNHTAMAFMAAFVMTRFFGRWYIFYFLATVVAISRVYLGVHYPSDVVAGACVGTIIGFILIRVAEYVKFSYEKLNHNGAGENDSG